MSSVDRVLILITILFCSLSAAVPQLQVLYTIFILLCYGLSVVLVPNELFYRNARRFIFYLLLPFIISLVLSLPVNYIINSNYDFAELSIIGRLVNIIGLTLFFFCLHNLFIKERLSLEQIVRFYYYSCGIMLVTAIWQALDLYTNLPVVFPFETRAYFHSTGQDYSFSGRLTGIAQEPSYLASYLVDFWVLCFFTFYNNRIKKAIFRVLCICLVVLTFSPSAYISLFCLAIFEQYSLVKKKNKKSIGVLILFSLLFGYILISFLNWSGGGISNYFFSRIDNIGESTRFDIIATSLGTMFNDGNIFILLFGNGFKTFQIINTRFPTVIADTSNSLYVDVFFECGLIGFMILSSFFIYLIKKINKVVNDRYRIFGQLLAVDLIISSFYRADYASLRYFGILFVLFIIIYPFKILRDERNFK